MKEATGEANMTIVTVILIAAIVAIATPIITNMVNATENKTECQNKGCYWVGQKCMTAPSGGTAC